MIEVLKGIFELMSQFISGIYNLQIDLTPNYAVKIGDIVVVFVVIVCSIALVLSIIRKGDD